MKPNVEPVIDAIRTEVSRIHALYESGEITEKQAEEMAVTYLASVQKFTAEAILTGYAR
jgi:hypothetical protein